jgi:tetratricopeptide (TPR) repeat protein
MGSEAIKFIRMILAGLLLLVLTGCGEELPVAGLDPLSLESFPIDGQIAQAIDLSMDQLYKGLSSSPLDRRLLRTERLCQKLHNPINHDSARDSLLSLLAQDRSDLFLLDRIIDLGLHRRGVPAFATIINNPAIRSSRTPAGLFMAGRLTADPSRALSYYLKSRLHQGELTRLQSDLLEYRIARRLGRDGMRASALKLLLGRLSWVRRSGGLVLEGIFWREIALNLVQLGRETEALHVYRHADRLYIRTGLEWRALQCLSDLAVTFARVGKTGTALNLLQQVTRRSETMGYPGLAMEALDLSATIYSSLDEIRMAINYQQEILVRAGESGDKNRERRTLVKIARSLMELGLLDSALAKLGQIAPDDVDDGDTEFNRERLWIESDLSLLQGRYHEADSLISLADTIGNGAGRPEIEINRLLRLSRYGREMGRPELSFRALQRLARLKGDGTLAGSIVDLDFQFDLEAARLRLETGEFNLARRHMAGAARSLQKRHSHGKAAMLWDLRGQLAHATGEVEPALAALDSALTQAGLSGRPPLISRQHRVLGQVLLESGRVSEAVIQFQMVGHSLDMGPGHRTIQERQLSLGICALANDDPRGAEEIFLGTLNRSGDNMGRDLKALFLLELGETQQQLGKHGPAYQNVVAACNLLTATQAAGGDQLRQVAGQILRRAYLLRIGLIIDHPHLLTGANPARESLRLRLEMRDLAWGRPPATTLPDPREASVIYLLDGERGYLWFMKDRGVTLTLIPGSGEITPQVEILQRTTGQAGRPPALLAGEKLSEYLLKPLGDRWAAGDLLQILPDNSLYGLPWELLPWRDFTVLDHGPITIATGLATGETGLWPAGPAGDLMVVGYNGDPNIEDDHLLLAEDEAREIGRLWPAGVHLLVGEEARGDLLDAACARSWDTIHLAVHARVHQGISNQSYLHLATAREASPPLTVRRISNLNLQADLVFLSCCEARSDIRSPEGAVLDLARAFVAGGATSVIASSHRVDDRAALEFARRFYRHRLNGQDLPRALQRTQLELREGHSPWKHPFYWVGYQLLTPAR